MEKLTKEQYRTAFLDYMDLGWVVLPSVVFESMEKDRDGNWEKVRNKFPLVKWGVFQGEVPTIDVVEGWIEKYWMYGGMQLVMGREAGVIAVDFDQKEGKLDLMEYAEVITDVMWTRTASGGMHCFYRSDRKFRNGTNIFDGDKYKGDTLVDIKAEGGIITVAPTVLWSSNPRENNSATVVGQYVSDGFVRPEELTELPVMFEKRRKKEPSTLNTGITSQLKMEVRNTDLRGEFDVPTGKGKRNPTCLEYAGKLVSRMAPSLWDDHVLPTLIKWNEKNCVPPMTVEEVTNTYKSACDMQMIDPSGINGVVGKSILPVKKADEFEITSYRQIMEYEPPENPWIIHSMIPEFCISSIVGETGRGKSVFMLQMVKSISMGVNLFDIEEFKIERKRKVLLIDQEMHKNVIVNRMKSFFYDMLEGDVDIDIMCEQFIKIDNPEHYEWLKEKILEMEYEVVIFDTWVNIHGMKENSADDVKIINELLLRLITDCKISIIFLHHKKKPMDGGKSEGVNSARGSTEITAKSASNIEVTSKSGMDDDLNTKTEMVVNQSKQRFEIGFQKFAVDCFYDPKEKKTWWEYKGVSEGAVKVVEVAKGFILEVLGEYEDFDGYESKKSLMAKVEARDEIIGKTNIDSALKELKDKQVLEAMSVKELRESDIDSFKFDEENGKAYVYKFSKSGARSALYKRTGTSV